MSHPILLALSLAFAISATLPPELPAQEKKVLLRFERYGGFAGFHDDITIYADFSYVLETPDHLKHRFVGELSKEDRESLSEHLKAFGYYFFEHDDGTKVRDGMKTRLELNAFAEDDDAKGDVRALNRLVGKIISSARAGEKTPK